MKEHDDNKHDDDQCDDDDNNRPPVVEYGRNGFEFLKEALYNIRMVTAIGAIVTS